MTKEQKINFAHMMFNAFLENALEQDVTELTLQLRFKDDGPPSIRRIMDEEPQGPFRVEVSSAVLN